MDASEYCVENKMIINTDKTKVVLFNAARKYDFQPQLTLDGTSQLEVVEEFRLLGINFQSNLSWQSNTDLMCLKGYSRIWMIRRLSKLGASQTDMLDVYNKQIRSVLELAVAVWTPGLTKQEGYQIDRVQKYALHFILGETYLSYDSAVKSLNIEKLCDRRQKRISLNFAKRCEKHPKYANWFKQAEIIKPLILTRTENASPAEIHTCAQEDWAI